MTFKEFHLSMLKNPVLGKLLPLECRKTYPALTREGEHLCAAFVGFRMRPGPAGAQAQSPAYYLKITYPQCAVRAFVRFPNPSPDWQSMTPQEPEVICRLSSLCDQVLDAYDNKSEELPDILQNYQTLLYQILEAEQRDVLDMLAQIERRGQR